MIVYDTRFLEHVPSPGHVERPDRLRAIVDRLKQEGLFEDVVPPSPATIADIRKVHREPYVDWFQRMGDGFLDPETPVDSGTFDVALLSAGAVLQATRTSVREDRPAVALVRPPGHHAGPDYGGGFCYLNNVAVAAADQATNGHRVAILDFDAHHGNGTRDIFADRPDVLYVSTHEYRIFPGTGPAEDVGQGEGRGFTVNVPFPAGCGDASYLLAFDSVVAPILEQFRPDSILMSLGVDAHYRDPLTSLTLSSPGYVELVGRSARLAHERCGDRFVMALEGGYDLEALGDVIAGSVGRVHGKRVELRLKEIADAEGRGREAIERTKRAHREFWNLR